MNNNKCDFCSNIGDYKEYKRGQREIEEIFYNSKKNEYVLVLEQFRCEWSALEIKYCPLCGRKLITKE